MNKNELKLGGALLALGVAFILAGVLDLTAAGGQAGAAPSAGAPAKSQARSPLQTSISDSASPSAASRRSRSAAKPASTATSDVISAAAGRRDPFKPWQPSAGIKLAAGKESGALPPGNRGLVISQLRVEGIVHLQPANTMIAMVTNYTKRAYFLRENDTVSNGVVSRITPDAVYFKEEILDSKGRPATHEVVLRLGLAAGEGR